MRTTFHEQLSALGAQIGEMCGLVVDAMEHATHALLEADLSVAEQVIADQAHIVAMSRNAEDSAVKLLALQQPVASDLRAIVGSMHIGADLERMVHCPRTLPTSPGCVTRNALCPTRFATASPKWEPSQCN